MAGVNKAILVGNLGRDPEVRYTKSGQAVATFSLATTEKWKNRDGEREEKTEWHRVVAWGKLGETCGEYLSKGKQVYIEGRIQTREWQDNDGVSKITTEIVCNNMVMLSNPGGGGGGGQRQYQDQRPQTNSRPNNSAPQNTPDLEEDDIPF